MAPRIQYALTSDGVSIAFTTTGEGLPFLMAPPVPFSHVQLEWEDEANRAWLETFARAGRVIRYDNRGSCLSDRNVDDISREALGLDIDAVSA
jgi:pimeloyl-ACP methyl ester carboxylesterase